MSRPTHEPFAPPSLPHSEFELIRRGALKGDQDAICEHLMHEGIDPTIVSHVRQLRQRSTSMLTKMEARIRALLYIKRLREDRIDPVERINAMMEIFPLKSNVIEHLIGGQGYSAERTEAKRRIEAERT
jgi:hypothetical protein